MHRERESEEDALDMTEGEGLHGRGLESWGRKMEGRRGEVGRGGD